MRKTLACVTLIALCASCGKSPRHATFWSQIEEVGSSMTGTFRCESPQSGSRAMRLDIIEFWPKHDDSGVLYAEWAYADEIGKPLRQEVYHVQRFDDTSAAIVVFALKDPARYAGAWARPELLDTLKKDGLVERPSCLMGLSRKGPGRFVGGTIGEGCLGSEEAGAFVRRLDVSPERLVWSQGGKDEEAPRTSDAEGDGDVYVKVANRPFR